MIDNLGARMGVNLRFAIEIILVLHVFAIVVCIGQ